MENQIERIYSVRIEGYDTSLKNLKALTTAFGALDSAKKKAVDDLAGAVKAGDAAAVERLTEKLNEQEKALRALTAQLQKAEKELAALAKQPPVNPESRKAVTDLTLYLKQYQALVNQNAAAQAKLNASQSDAGKKLADTREQQRLLNLETKNQVTANKAAEGSLIQMRAQLSLLTRAYDGLGKAERESDQGSALLEKIKVLNLALTQAEAASGRYQRSVGNYKSAFDGLGMSFTQLSRELPSLTISAQQFFLAISNNLPMLADEIAKARREVAALKAEGKDTPSLFSRITGAMFSWQTALSVGIVLLTAYGKEIFEWAKGLFRSADAAKLAAANMVNLNEVMSNANKSAAEELTTLKLLYGAATDVNRPMKDRLENVEALKSTFPEYFAQLNNEVILNGQAKKSYDDLAASILTAARAEAGKKKLQDLEAQKLDIEDRKRKIDTATANEKEDIRRKQPKATSQGVQFDAERLNITVEEAQKLRDQNLLKSYQAIIEKRRQDALNVQEEQLKSLNAQSDFVIKFVGADNLFKKTLTIEEAKNAKLNEDQLNAVIKNIDVQRAVLKEGDPKLKQLEADRDLFQKRLDTLNNKQTKTKTFAGARLSGEDKDDLKRIEADRDKELNKESLRISQIRELRRLSFEEEVEHVKKLQVINDNADQRKIAAIKGNNAEEERLKASLILDISKRNVESQKQIQDLKDKEFAKEVAVLKKGLAAQISNANIGVSITEADPTATYERRAQEKVTADTKIINLTTVYYETLETLARKYNVDISTLEEEKENATKELVAKSLNDKRLLAQASIEDIAREGKRRVTQIETDFAKERQKILENNKLNADQKKRQLELLDQAEKRSILSAELEALTKDVARKKELLDEGLLSNEDYLAAIKAQQEKATQLSQVKSDTKLSSITAALPKQGGAIDLIKSLTKEKISVGKDKKGKDVDGSELFGNLIAESYNVAQTAMQGYFDAERQRVEESKQLAYKRIDIEKAQLLAAAQSQTEKDSIEKQAQVKREKADKEAGEHLKRVKKSEAKIALGVELANIAVAAAGNPANPFTFGAAGIAMYAALAGLAFARYAVNIKNIDSQQFARGGDVPSRGGRFGGRPHSQGGTPFTFKGNHYEAEVDELSIIRTKNAPANKKFTVTGTQMEIASAANVIGGGVNFRPGAKVKSFASGGVISTWDGNNRMWGDNLKPPINPQSFLSPAGAANAGDMKAVFSKISEQSANIEALSNNVAEVSAGLAQVSAQTNQRIDKLKVINDPRETTAMSDKIKVANSIGTI